MFSIFGASWLHTHQIDKRFDQMDKRFEELNKHFAALLDSLRADFRHLENSVDNRFKRVEGDISEIKTELKRFFKPII